MSGYTKPASVIGIPEFIVKKTQRPEDTKGLVQPSGRQAASIAVLMNGDQYCRSGRTPSRLCAIAPFLQIIHREGPMSIRRLAQQLGRDYKSVHSETTLLIQTGYIERTAADEVRIGWDRIVS